MDGLPTILPLMALLMLGSLLFGRGRRHSQVRANVASSSIKGEDGGLRPTHQVRDIAREMELRVYEYGREVEARIETQLTMLDQLILEADREIGRLEGILAESRHDWPVERALSRSEQQRCFAMHEAGFDVEEIARCLNTTVDPVRQALDEWQPRRRDAA